MTDSRERGFTLIEVLISIIILSVGVLALLQGSAAVTRMLRDGRERSRATAMATTRLERIRQLARTTTPNCTSLTSGSQSYANGTTEAWTVAGTGFQRTVTVSVGFRLGTRSSSQTYRTTLLCQ